MFFIKREYDNAIRICAYLASNYRKGPIALSELSEKLFITRPFATKIVFRLKRSNIVKTVQGKHGGVYLDSPPDKLSLHAIIKGMGHDVTISECIQRLDYCPLPPPCKIHSFFIEQEDSLINHLKSRYITEFAFTDSDFDPEKTK
jgi:Rrf2 family nitric oxide-sensitive transcriptional repressor